MADAPVPPAVPDPQAQGPEERPRRRRGHSINRLIPNILTLMALSAGVTSIRFALNGQWQEAVIAIVVAAVLDGLDGRIARALGASSRFGAELDSLSDFVAFGVAPGLVVYLWSLNEAQGLGWAITLLYAVCCALRLARFNTQLDTPEAHRAPWRGLFFVGVPAPAGAGLALLPMIFWLQFESDALAHPLLTGATLFVVAALMASTLPTFSFKRARVPGRRVALVLLAAGFILAFLLSTPWITLGCVGLLYAASIPMAILVFRDKARREALLADLEGLIEEEDEDAPEPPSEQRRQGRQGGEKDA